MHHENPDGGEMAKNERQRRSAFKKYCTNWVLRKMNLGIVLGKWAHWLDTHMMIIAQGWN
jgi:hypothetical protein